jgi:hypothetical protein
MIDAFTLPNRKLQKARRFFRFEFVFTITKILSYKFLYFICYYILYSLNWSGWLVKQTRKGID